MRGRILVAGGGMAGLVAAVRATELGALPALHEKGTRLGGSMLLSSGVVWRHASPEQFRRECPGGEPGLQQALVDRLDEAIAWLRRLGAPVVHEGTGNPRTVGVRFDPAGLRDNLLACLPPDCISLSAAPLGRPDLPATVLATGGFAADSDLVARFVAPAAPLRLRGNPWSTGDGLRHAVAHGADLSDGMGEFYGRNMPAADWREAEFVSLAQLYARAARIFDRDGVEFIDPKDVSWSEIEVVQATARRPGATAYYLLSAAALEARVAGRRVGDMVAAAPAAARVRPDALPFCAPTGVVAAVKVVASITHTIGGLRVDPLGRVLDGAGAPVAGLYAAGVDAGGFATGGYASGLAQALVFGLAAAESAVAAAS